MRILLDENLDHRMRVPLSPHQVATVSFLGWSGLKDNDLLKAAEDDGFQLLLTGDQTLFSEQSPNKKRRLAIVALSSIEWPIVKNHLSAIITAIDDAVPGSYSFIDCGRFSRNIRAIRQTRL